MHCQENQPINTAPSHPASVPSCDKCQKPAIALVRYSGAHLCPDHFTDFVERRVKHQIRRQVDLVGGERIAVAVSGGKDSTVALHLVHKILGDRRQLDISAITIDEGIEGYRESCLPIVQEQCKHLGVEHRTASFDGLFGTTMDRVARTRRDVSTCTYCGVLRRAAMNRTAREWGATHLATGLNLDDTAQSILMNISRGDVERLTRLGPHRKSFDGLVPRIQPLRAIPESETTLYAIVNGLRYHDLECPYAPEALRNSYRSVVAMLEDEHPGTRHAILKSYDELLPMLEDHYPSAALRKCACGEPTAGTKCKACALVEDLNTRTACTGLRTKRRSACRSSP